MKNFNTIIPPLLLLSFLLNFSNLQAQDTTFYDTNWKEVKKRKDAKYYGFFTKEGKLWKAEDHYASNDKLQNTGYYFTKKRKTRTAIWTYYWESGNKSSEYEYKRDERDGPYKEWYENGQLKREGNYKKGEREGLWSGWYDNGNQQFVVEYTSEAFPDVISFWYKDGKTGVAHGNGSFEQYHSNGNVYVSGEIKNRKREGEYKSFYPGGELLEKVYFKNNQASGAHQYFYESGELEATGFQDRNKTVGMWTYYEKDGTVFYLKDLGTYEVPADDLSFEFGTRNPFAQNIALIKRLIGYPELARKAGIQGQVICRILVDKDGNYLKHKFIKQNHPIFTDAILKHVDKLKFTRAFQGGKPIKFWVNIPFNFKLLN